MQVNNHHTHSSWWENGRFPLNLTRLLWIVTTLILLTLFIAGLKPRYDELTTLCLQEPCLPLILTPPDAAALTDMGFSLHQYALFHVGLEVVLNSFIVLLACLIFFPATMVISMMRYRLWDVDLLIRRTVTYGLVTALLAAVYLGGVILIQTIFRSLTGTSSQIAIVLNFDGLDYMNSSGIGLLVTMLIRAQREKQQLLAYGLSEHYQQIFELTRLNEAIGIHENETVALTAVATPA